MRYHDIVNEDTSKPNGLDAASSPSLSSTGQKWRLGRTLFTAAVFALSAMIYVPTPRQRGIHPGYRFIFSAQDTSVAFSQLLLNVAFAALLGAILTVIVSKIPKRVFYVIVPCMIAVALAAVVFGFCHAAAIRAQSDEENAEQLLVFYPTDSQWMLTKFRNAALNWRLALHFDEARRVENRIKELQQRREDWRSDPIVQPAMQPPQISGQRALTPFPSPR